MMFLGHDDSGSVGGISVAGCWWDVGGVGIMRSDPSVVVVLADVEVKLAGAGVTFLIRGIVVLYKISRAQLKMSTILNRSE